MRVKNGVNLQPTKIELWVYYYSRSDNWIRRRDVGHCICYSIAALTTFDLYLYYSF